MRVMFIFFLLLVLGALGYVLWHVWCVLPFTKPLKWLAVLLLAAILVSMFLFIGGGLDKMPLNLASVMYEVSTSSVIVLLYLVLTFFLMDVARCCHLLPRSLFHESWTATLSILVLLTAVFVAERTILLRIVLCSITLTRLIADLIFGKGFTSSELIQFQHPLYYHKLKEKYTLNKIN